MPSCKPARRPRLMWADYDPSYQRSLRLSVYFTKSDQRANRPDLQPIPVCVIPMESAAAAREVIASITNLRTGPSFHRR